MLIVPLQMAAAMRTKANDLMLHDSFSSKHGVDNFGGFGNSVAFVRMVVFGFPEEGRLQWLSATPSTHQQSRKFIAEDLAAVSRVNYHASSNVRDSKCVRWRVYRQGSKTTR